MNGNKGSIDTRESFKGELEQGVWAVVVTFLVAIGFAAMAPDDPQLRIAAGFLAFLAAGLGLVAWRIHRRPGGNGRARRARHA